MEYTNFVTASRTKESDHLKNMSEIEEVYKMTDINEEIVTRVNGTTKPLLDTNNWQSDKSENVIWNSYRDDCKWQVPCYHFRHRKFQMGKKLMNKSIKKLFENIKPDRHVSVAKQTHILQSFRTKKNILKSDEFFYRKKVARKFHFLSICEEAPTPFFISDNQNQSNTQIKNEEMDWALEEFESKTQIREDSSPESEKIRKAISSEDFVQNVFFKKLI